MMNLKTDCIADENLYVISMLLKSLTYVIYFKLLNFDYTQYNNLKRITSWISVFNFEINHL